MKQQAIDFRIFFDQEILNNNERFGYYLKQFLDNIKGSVLSMCCGAIGDKELDKLKNKFYDQQQYFKPNDFFTICSTIRRKNKITNENIYIVIITNKQNDEKLLSATDGKNIFINLYDIERYSTENVYLSIAHQMIENVFQSLLGLTYENKDSLLKLYNSKETSSVSLFHDNVKGCINDNTGIKNDFIAKFKKSYICNNCINKALELGVDEFLINELKTILKAIKNSKSVNMYVDTNEESVVKINSEGRILIKGVDSKIAAREAAFYILFIKHNEGLKLYELKKYINEIEIYYQFIKKKRNVTNYKTDTNIHTETLLKLITPKNNGKQSIDNNINKINNCINDLVENKHITKNESELFKLKKHNDECYRITIAREKISIHEKFNLTNK